MHYFKMPKEINSHSTYWDFRMTLVRTLWCISPSWTRIPLKLPSRTSNLSSRRILLAWTSLQTPKGNCIWEIRKDWKLSITDRNVMHATLLIHSLNKEDDKGDSLKAHGKCCYNLQKHHPKSNVLIKIWIHILLQSHPVPWSLELAAKGKRQVAIQLHYTLAWLHSFQSHMNLNNRNSNTN